MQWLVANNGNYTQHIGKADVLALRGEGFLSCSGVETNHCKDMAGRMTTSFDFIPSTGRHFMKFNGTWRQVESVLEYMFAFLI